MIEIDSIFGLDVGNSNSTISFWSPSKAENLNPPATVVRIGVLDETNPAATLFHNDKEMIPKGCQLKY